MPDVTSSTFLNSASVPASSAAAAVSTAPASSTTKTLGQDDFLKLLMAELQNQDPSQPMDDSQTIAQMAQFSALQATESLKQTIQQSSNVQSVLQAGALIGRYIQSNQADGTSISGAVTGVDFTSTNGTMSPTLVVNGKDVDYSTIVKVSASPISATGSAATPSTSAVGTAPAAGTTSTSTSTSTSTATSTATATTPTTTTPITATAASATTSSTTPPTTAAATAGN